MHSGLRLRVEVLILEHDQSAGTIRVLQVHDDDGWRLPGTSVPAGVPIPDAARQSMEDETGMHMTLARLLAMDQTTSPHEVVLILDGGHVGPERARLVTEVSKEVASLPLSRWGTLDQLQEGPARIGYAVAAAHSDLPLPVLVDGQSDVARWHAQTAPDAPAQP